MDRLYSRFPDGNAGLGLLLLRLIVATRFFETGISTFGAGPIECFFAVVLMGTALLLIAGVGTSANASVAAIVSIVLLLLGNEPDQWLPVMSVAAASGALALLGPGGYSLDARLSGWRTIDLSSRQDARPSNRTVSGDPDRNIGRNGVAGAVQSRDRRNPSQKTSGSKSQGSDA